MKLNVLMDPGDACVFCASPAVLAGQAAFRIGGVWLHIIVPICRDLDCRSQAETLIDFPSPQPPTRSELII
jgi:hypothetical protein